jgi:hypothetical protein
MTKFFSKILFLLVLTTVWVDIFAQGNHFEQYIKTPKDTTKNFTLDYKISRPRLEYPNWDKDFDVYYNFHTPAIRKTQASFSYNDTGVVTTVTPNSIIPHTQLDTTTAVNDSKRFFGTWRMIKFRSMRFNDSVNLPTKTYYRLPDVLLEDRSSDEAFAVISENNFKLYAKEIGKTDFKKMMSAKYKIENSRFILMYKLAKSGGGVSQIGIDEKGYLILNYPKVIENIKKGEYFSYYAIIEQYIFEKVE